MIFDVRDYPPSSAGTSQYVEEAMRRKLKRIRSIGRGAKEASGKAGKHSIHHDERVRRGGEGKRGYAAGDGGMPPGAFLSRGRTARTGRSTTEGTSRYQDTL